MKISIVGYYGVPNIGDEGILAALLRKVRREFPSASIKVSAMNQSYVSRMHAVGTYPLEQRTVSFLAEMMQSDLLLVGGGGLLFDNPLQVLPFWLGKIMTARFAGTPSILYSVGVGPITRRVSRFYLRFALRFAELISVRDESSASLLRGCGIDNEIIVLPDPAFLLPPASEKRAQEILRKEGVQDTGALRVGISLRYWRGFDRIQEARFLSQIANTIDRLAERYDMHFVLVPFRYCPPDQPASGDIGLMDELASHCRRRENVHIVRGQYSPGEVMALLGQMDLNLGMKLHSVIFSSIMGVPCIGLSYAEKVATHMEIFDSSNFCLPIDTVSEDRIVNLVETIIRDRAYYSARLHSVSDIIVRETDRLHDEMLARVRDMF